MSLRFGWRIEAQMWIDTEDRRFDYLAHAYCVMPDGRTIDITGKPTIKGDYVRSWSIEEFVPTLGKPQRPPGRQKATRGMEGDRQIYRRHDRDSSMMAV